ncbi:PGAP1-domain-containing protein [Obba rivulosa]|uniref:GPI inositol-deacylase n=1 Tax=Obba rivulosa TaxID=1052685 RepID=A0A8E2DU68_9APHY|nr:PGAP1-domain-containing protein [Obba rivulosa]
MSKLLYLISLFSILCAALFYQSALDIVSTLSPQGCRMSRMSPSYLFQAEFDERWTPLARRYSLWLYREVGWESHELHGAPVLFIPGNAGSSHQVRSIASSATRQYFSLPYQIAPEFQGGLYKPLDFFALEFNEDLSAFHGPTLDAETAYTKAAIDYILSLYPSRPQSIILLGHSMGGIVANALLPHPNVSAVITMSTPHTLPPARFDRRVDALYASIYDRLDRVTTPILSLCGGATDLMIPSESCVLPPISPSESMDSEHGSAYRRTIFTSALEGSWTGVGHREMVWCHQVRWRVARAALELAAAPTTERRAQALDRWIRDGSEVPVAQDAEGMMRLHEGEAEVLPSGMRLVLREPRGAKTYLLPVPRASDSADSSSIGSDTARFVLFVRGSVPPVAPQASLSLRVSVFACSQLSFSDTNRTPGSAFSECTKLQSTTHKVLPQPVSGAPFPVPDEGSDESEGIVLFEAELFAAEAAYVAVKVDGADGHGWAVGGFVEVSEVVSDASALAPIISTVSIKLPEPRVLKTSVRLPHILTSSLLVYRVTPTFVDSEIASCSDALLPPLLEHTSLSPMSHSPETHYHPLLAFPTRPILLHSHTSGPFVSPPSTGLDLSFYSSSDTGCALEELRVTLDWWGTLGRVSTRYASSASAWAVAVVSTILWDALSQNGDGPVPSVHASLQRFVSHILPRLVPILFALSVIPLPVGFYVGNGGALLLSPVAPLLVLVASGLVVLSWGVLALSIWLAGLPMKLFGARPKHSPDVSDHSTRSAMLGFAFVLALIALVVPWQVAFLGAWVYHFWTCAAQSIIPPIPEEHAPGTGVAIPLMPTNPHPSSPLSDEDPRVLRPRSRSSSLRSPSPPPSHTWRGSRPSDTFHQSAHLLLLLTWLLPLAAPVLAVWVRTLATAGLMAPFGGDHNVLCVAPALVVVEWAGRGHGALCRSSRWAFLVLAAVAFLAGLRRTYLVFEIASTALAWIVVAKAGPGWLRRLRR